MKVCGFKYATFGIRKEWMLDFLSRSKEFFENNSLGPKQIEAFVYYLRDIELIDKNLNLTELFSILKEVFKKEGFYSKVLWGVVWINLCFNSPLFNWWANIPPGKYKKEEIINLLADSYGKMNRSVISGYSSIIETLSKSPIGELLGQGIIERKGRKVSVIKNSNNDMPSILVLYNLYKFSKRKMVYKINLKEIEEDSLSPQKILSLSSSEVEESIVKSSAYESFYSIDFEDQKTNILLKEDINSIKLLKIYWGGL